MTTPAPPAAAARSRRSRVLRVVRVLLMVAVIAALGVTIAVQWGEVRQSLRGLDPLLLAASWLAAVASVAFSAMSWRAALAELGSPLPLREGNKIFLVGQLGKYLPGSIWSIVTQMELAQARGVPRFRTATAGLMALGLGVVFSSLLGVPALLLVLPGEVGLPLVVVGVAVLLAVLHPRPLTAAVNLVARITRRPALERPLGLRGVLVAELWALAASLALGLHAYLLVRGLAPEGSPGPLAVISAFSLAVAGGLLFLPAPAGAGAREGVLLLALAPSIGVGPAGALALVSRAVLTLADAVTAGTAALGVRRPRADRRHP